MNSDKFAVDFSIAYNAGADKDEISQLFSKYVTCIFCNNTCQAIDSYHNLGEGRLRFACPSCNKEWLRTG